MHWVLMTKTGSGTVNILIQVLCISTFLWQLLFTHFPPFLIRLPLVFLFFPLVRAGSFEGSYWSEPAISVLQHCQNNKMQELLISLWAQWVTQTLCWEEEQRPKGLWESFMRDKLKVCMRQISKKLSHKSIPCQCMLLLLKGDNVTTTTSFSRWSGAPHQPKLTPPPRLM